MPTIIKNPYKEATLKIVAEFDSGLHVTLQPADGSAALRSLHKLMHAIHKGHFDEEWEMIVVLADTPPPGHPVLDDEQGDET